MTLQEKRAALEELLRPLGRVVVAFSGGVDSTLLAVLARKLLGRPHVLAVTAQSPSMAPEDLADARQLARQLDLTHLVIATDEVGRAEYQANTPARCFVCKQTLFEALNSLATRDGFRAVLYGALADDLPGERPGQHAAVRYAVRAPLQEAGFEKWDVRELAKAIGLPNWDKPQNACLSSRIPHGHVVTVEKLQQVAQAERCLRAEGFRQVRVRHLGAHARIEVEPDDVMRFQDGALRRRVEQAFERLGFQSVGVDRSGYRAGGADRTVVEEVQLGAVGAW